MTDTHTPGPWATYPSHEPRQVNVAMAGSIIGHAVAFGYSQDEAEANARLIAAAPELLEALAGMIEMATHHAMDDGEKRAILKAARAAIAKAKGE